MIPNGTFATAEDHQLVNAMHTETPTMLEEFLARFLSYIVHEEGLKLKLVGLGNHSRHNDLNITAHGSASLYTLDAMLAPVSRWESEEPGSVHAFDLGR